MKAYEFPVKIAPDGKIELPNKLSKLLPNNQTIRVIILVEEQTDDDQVSWSHITTEQFLAGYSEVDVEIL
jgi:hypothetical protein